MERIAEEVEQQRRSPWWIFDNIFTFWIDNKQAVGSDDTIDSDVDYNGWACFSLFANEDKDDLDAGLVSAY